MSTKTPRKGKGSDKLTDSVRILFEGVKKVRRDEDDLRKAFADVFKLDDIRETWRQISGVRGTTVNPRAHVIVAAQKRARSFTFCTKTHNLVLNIEEAFCTPSPQGGFTVVIPIADPSNLRGCVSPRETIVEAVFCYCVKDAKTVCWVQVLTAERKVILLFENTCKRLSIDLFGGIVTILQTEEKVFTSEDPAEASSPPVEGDQVTIDWGPDGTGEWIPSTHYVTVPDSAAADGATDSGDVGAGMGISGATLLASLTPQEEDAWIECMRENLIPVLPGLALAALFCILAVLVASLIAGVEVIPIGFAGCAFVILGGTATAVAGFALDCLLRAVG